MWIRGAVETKMHFLWSLYGDHTYWDWDAIYFSMFVQHEDFFVKWQVGCVFIYYAAMLNVLIIHIAIGKRNFFYCAFTENCVWYGFKGGGDANTLSLSWTWSSSNFSRTLTLYPKCNYIRVYEHWLSH